MGRLRVVLVLEPGVDYKEFELSPQLGRVEPFVYPLTDEQDELAERLLRESVCISLHDHCGIKPVDMTQNDEYVREGREWYGYEGLAASGLDAVFKNFLDGTATITSKGGWKWTDVIHDLGMHLADVAHQSTVFVGGTVDDIVEAHRSGRIAMVPCMEGAAMIENELDRLDVLFGLGVRMCGVAYSESNQLGGGVKDPGDGGLTRFGLDAVRRMNRLGMAIDVSHTGDVTVMQTCEVSERPVFLSHSGARALFSERKLKEDVLLKAVAENGGVIGIEGSPHTTISPAHPRHSLEGVMDHFEYCIDVMGSIMSGSVPTRSSATTWGSTSCTRATSTPGRSASTSRSPTSRGWRIPRSSRTWSGGSSVTTTPTSRSRRSSGQRAEGAARGLGLTRPGRHERSLEGRDEALDRVGPCDGCRAEPGVASCRRGDRTDADHLRGSLRGAERVGEA